MNIHEERLDQLSPDTLDNLQETRETAIIVFFPGIRSC